MLFDINASILLVVLVCSTSAQGALNFLVLGNDMKVPHIVQLASFDDRSLYSLGEGEERHLMLS
jgi:hypothetical protein